MSRHVYRHFSKIYNILSREYPDSMVTGLRYHTPFQLLVATILSAQCTDSRVNKITGTLFDKYNQPEDFAFLSPEELEPLIRGCGLYRNKSRNIIKASRIIVEKYGSEVPRSFEELCELPGVGRKTANVVLNAAFEKPVMPVDTHVFRVSRRLGLARGKTPESVENELLNVVPPEQRGDFHLKLILHGRNTCRARNPLCSECNLGDICPSARPREQ